MPVGVCVQVRVWQALCVLCPVVPPAEAEAALGPLLGALAVLDAPSVQQFQETAVLQLVARQPALLRARLLPLLLDYRAAKADSPVASLILVAAQAVVLLQPERHPQHYSRLGSWQQRGGAARQGGAEEHGEQQQPLEWADGGAGAGVPQASSSGFRVCVGEQQRQQEQQGEQLGQQQQQWGEHQLEEELREWEGLLRDVALAIMPWTLAHPHHMRCFAGVILARLCDLWPTLLLTDATGAALRAFLRQAPPNSLHGCLGMPVCWCIGSIGSSLAGSRAAARPRPCEVPSCMPLVTLPPMTPHNLYPYPTPMHPASMQHQPGLGPAAEGGRG